MAGVVKAVSRQLGNTPAVCRACYIHPAILDAYLASYEHRPLAQALGRQLAAASETAPTETAPSEPGEGAPGEVLSEGPSLDLV